MYLLLYLLIIVVGMFSKKKNGIFVLVTLFTILTVYMHTSCPDYENYNNVYNYIKNGNWYMDTGLGWYYICSFFIKLGVSFRIFKTIICFISILLTNITIKRFASRESQSKFWTLYFIYPLLLQYIQFRFFLGMSLILFSFVFTNNKRLINKIIQLLIIVFASLIHSSLIIIVMMYLLIQVKVIRKSLKKSTIIIGTLCLMLMLLFEKDLIVQFVSYFVNSVRIERYFTVSNNSSSFMTLILSTLLISLNYFGLNSIIDKKNEKELKIVRMTDIMNALSFIIIPLLILDNNFIRIIELLMTLTYLSLLIKRDMGEKYVKLLKIRINTVTFLLLISILGLLILIPKQSVLISLLF